MSPINTYSDFIAEKKNMIKTSKEGNTTVKSIEIEQDAVSFFNKDLIVNEAHQTSKEGDQKPPKIVKKFKKRATIVIP
jgi:hypothetical protein